MDRIGQAQGRSALALLRVGKGHGTAHAQLDMITQRIDEDGQDHHELGRRNDGLQRHAHHHDEGAEFIDLLRGEHVQDRKDEHKKQARQFAEELGDALIE